MSNLRNSLLNDDVYLLCVSVRKTNMDKEEYDKIILKYLRKRGFTQTEQIFQQEQQNNKNAADASQLDPDLAKQINSFSQ